MRTWRGTVERRGSGESTSYEVQAETAAEAQESIGRRWWNEHPQHLPPTPESESEKLVVRVWPKELEERLAEFGLKPTDDIRRIMITDTIDWMLRAGRRPDGNVYRTDFEFRYTGLLDGGAKEVPLKYEQAVTLVEAGAKCDAPGLDHLRRK